MLHTWTLSSTPGAGASLRVYPHPQITPTRFLAPQRSLQWHPSGRLVAQVPLQLGGRGHWHQGEVGLGLSGQSRACPLLGGGFRPREHVSPNLKPKLGRKKPTKNPRCSYNQNPTDPSPGAAGPHTPPPPPALLGEAAGNQRGGRARGQPPGLTGRGLSLGTKPAWLCKAF